MSDHDEENIENEDNIEHEDGKKIFLFILILSVMLLASIFFTR